MLRVTLTLINENKAARCPGTAQGVWDGLGSQGIARTGSVYLGAAANRSFETQIRKILATFSQKYSWFISFAWKQHLLALLAKSKGKW